MDKTRAMLDALMGPSRDVKLKKAETKEQFKEQTVCKGFLLGFCPCDKTALGGKRSIEVCRKVHSDSVKAQFEESPEVEKHRREYQLLLLRDLERLARDCDTFVTTERQRIKEDARKDKVPLSHEVRMNLKALSTEAARLISMAETLPDDNVQEREDLMNKANELKKECTNSLTEETKKARDFQMQNLPQACNTCGTAYANEAEREKHLEYRLHAGFAKVREMLAELEPKRAELEKAEAEELRQKRRDRQKKDANDGVEGTRGSERRSSRCRDRDRLRSPQRGGRDDKARRARSMDRKGGRHGDRDQNRSRERRSDQSGDRCQDRSREPGNSRNAERSRSCRRPLSRNGNRNSPSPLRQRRSPSIRRSKSNPKDPGDSKALLPNFAPQWKLHAVPPAAPPPPMPPPKDDGISEYYSEDDDDDDLAAVLIEAIGMVETGRAPDFLRMSNGFFAECLRKVADASSAVPKKSKALFIEFLDSKGMVQEGGAAEIIAIMRSMQVLEKK